MTFEYGYLIIHGLTTLGALIIFLLRVEHRITRLETLPEVTEKRCLEHLKSEVR